jgi:hypothetical protein
VVALEDPGEPGNALITVVGAVQSAEHAAGVACSERIV